MYWRRLLILMALASAAVASPAGATPQSFKGTIEIRAHLLAPGRQPIAGESSSGRVDFKGHYRVQAVSGSARPICSRARGTSR